MHPLSPEVLVPICSLLSAIAVKLIDVLHDRLRESRARKAGQLTVSQKLDKVIADQDAMKDSIKKYGDVAIATARDRIYYLCKRYTEDKKYDARDLEDIQELYEPYVRAGGDGLAKELFSTYKEAYHEYNKTHATQKAEREHTN